LSVSSSAASIFHPYFCHSALSASGVYWRQAPVKPLESDWPPPAPARRQRPTAPLRSPRGPAHITWLARMKTKSKRSTKIRQQEEWRVRLRIICISPPNPVFCPRASTLTTACHGATSEWRRGRRGLKVIGAGEGCEGPGGGLSRSPRCVPNGERVHRPGRSRVICPLRAAKFSGRRFGCRAFGGGCRRWPDGGSAGLLKN
jgi:hypothetical protein